MLAASFAGSEDRIDDLAKKVAALDDLLGSEDGANLLAGYRRAANILRIENAKDGPHEGLVDHSLLREAPEKDLQRATISVGGNVEHLVSQRFYTSAIPALAKLRGPLDQFFDQVTVNSPEAEVRRNRLSLLSNVVSIMNTVADFSKIEG